MALWWSSSEDRIWNDPNQVSWQEVHMTQKADNLWIAPPVPVEPNIVIGWYVEARNTVPRGETELTRTDAGAVHFLREPEASPCEPVFTDWCGGGREELIIDD